MTLIRRSLVVVALVVLLPLAGHADDGFWPFNRIPKAAIKQALGVDITDQWLQRVQQASVRFPGGSGSFISPDGLVLTNHHVSLDMLHKLSTPERALASQGFREYLRRWGQTDLADNALYWIGECYDAQGRSRRLWTPSRRSSSSTPRVTRPPRPSSRRG